MTKFYYYKEKYHPKIDSPDKYVFQVVDNNLIKFY